MPDLNPTLIERFKAEFPEVDVEKEAAAVRADPSVRSQSAVLAARCKEARATAAHRAHIRDEAEFWAKWPNASRYYDPQERAAFAAEFPGWFPGCDLSQIHHQASVANTASDPSLLSRAEATALVLAEVRRLAAAKAMSSQKHDKHPDSCTCESCFAPYHLAATTGDFSLLPPLKASVQSHAPEKTQKN